MHMGDFWSGCQGKGKPRKAAPSCGSTGTWLLFLREGLSQVTLTSCFLFCSRSPRTVTCLVLYVGAVMRPRGAFHSSLPKAAETLQGLGSLGRFRSPLYSPDSLCL